MDLHETARPVRGVLAAGGLIPFPVDWSSGLRLHNGMSGPGGSTPPRGGNGGDGFDCDSLVVDTTLNSPEADVVKQLKKGSRLRVDLGKSPAGRDILLALTKDGKIAGSLTPPQVLDIMNCLRGGHSYIAEVQAEPSGGECRVRIRSGSL